MARTNLSFQVTEVEETLRKEKEACFEEGKTREKSLVAKNEELIEANDEGVKVVYDTFNNVVDRE